MNEDKTSIKDKFANLTNKKKFGVILIVAAVLIIGLVGWKRDKSPNVLAPSSAIAQGADPQADIVYYFGQECTRCNNIEKFIAANKVADKISFTRKEVWHDAASNADMQEKARECLLDPTKVGVPFLWARGKCYEGEVEVQNFLKKEVGI